MAGAHGLPPPRALTLRDENPPLLALAHAHHGDLAAGRAGGLDPAALPARFGPRPVPRLASASSRLLASLHRPSSSPGELPIWLRGARGRVRGHARRKWPRQLPSLAFAAMTAAGAVPSACAGIPERCRHARFGVCGTRRHHAAPSCDNASLTLPAWIEADLGRMFTEER